MEKDFLSRRAKGVGRFAAPRQLGKDRSGERHPNAQKPIESPGVVAEIVDHDRQAGARGRAGIRRLDDFVGR